MFKVMSKQFVLSLSVLALAVGIFLLPPLTLAADDLELTAETPTPYLERSQIIGTGKRISVYCLPTTNSSGELDYWDMTLDFTLDPKSGKPKKVKIVSVPSPIVYDNEFIPGTYFSEYSCASSYGPATCTVTTGVLKGGRMQVAFACMSEKGSYNISGSAVSGLVKGHPFAPDLQGAKIEEIEGYDQFSWGKVGMAHGLNNWWGCMKTGHVISAQQVGSSIVLSGYENGNVQKCGVTLTPVKQE